MSLVPTPSALATSTGSRYWPPSGRQAEAEEAGEGPNAGQHLGPAGAPHQLLDAAHQALGGVDIDAGRRVGGPLFLALVQGVHHYRGN